MEKQIDCLNFEQGCSAPLCPLNEDTIENQIWYMDEDRCSRRDFQNIDWVKRQKQIARVGTSPYKYFTGDMLRAIKYVRKGIEGINPDQPLQQARKAELRWIEQKKGGRVIANEKTKGRQAIAKKKDNHVNATNTSNKVEGGEL